MSVSSEFGRRAADDELCAAVRRAVEDGDADALRRLGLDGWGDYVQRLSELMGESVRDGLEPSEDFGELMAQVASPARYAHHLVTESGAAIQTAKDEPLGIHIKPLEPGFDDDALKGTVGTAANAESPEQVVETLADGLAYAVKKAGNEFVEKNAEQRSRAGFEVTVKRSGSSKCCEWCAARIGSWALKNAPDGVFGCHAKCSCVVEYTNSTGVTTQRRGTGRFVDVEYEPPHVMTYEEAREKGGFDEPKRLTGGGNGGILNYRDSSITDHSVTPQIISNMPESTVFSGEIGERYNAECRNLLTHIMNSGAEAGTEFSIILDEFMNRLEGHGYFSGKDGRTEIENADVLHHAFHNHGSDEMLSFSDIFNFSARSKQISISAVGNLGSNYILYTESRNQEEISKSKEKYLFYLLRQSTKSIIQTSTGEKITFRRIMKNADGIKTIIKDLPKTEQQQILKAVTSKTEEHIREGEKYGFKYYERRV